MPENPDVKWPPLLSLINMRSISKVRLFSFLLCLALTLLAMASYILPWEKTGLLFTPPPFQLRPVPVQTGTSERDSSENTLIDMKLLVKIKLEYSPRKVPDEKDVIETEAPLFSVIPRHFLPSIKSPCWYEEFSGDLGTDPYRRNHYTRQFKGFKDRCEKLKIDFHRHLYHRDGKVFRLRCLPYFYIIGQPKCGTTDLFQRLLLHPEVRFNIVKEPHWWTRSRFGYKDGFPEQDYLDLFDYVAVNIQAGINGNPSGDSSALRLITGDASASTMSDNRAWSKLHGGGEDAEPPFLAQDLIHAIQPGAKIIVILRDPVERLYSGYLYFMKGNKSADDFHLKVVKSVQMFHSCLSERTMRYCTYDTSLSVSLTMGMYVVFLLDWLTVFHREQILVLQMEHYSANIKVSIRNVCDFLSIDHLSEQVEAAMTKQPKSNTRHAADRNLGPMLPATRVLLREFYQPFNDKLASVLDNKAFLWSST